MDDVTPITSNNDGSPQPETNTININFRSTNKFGKLVSFLKNLLNNFKNKFLQKWYKLPRKWKVVIASFSAVLIIVGGLFLYKFIKSGGLKDLGRKEVDIAEFGDWKKLVIPQRQKPFFTLSASTVSKYGILPTEALILKTEKPVDVNFIKENIVSSVPVAVASIGGTEYRISPQRNLELEEVLSIKLSVEDKNYEGYTFDRNYSWAYQSQGKFRVVSSIPGDKKNEVPVNSGIEIAFSQDDFNDPTPFVSVSPSINFRTEVHADRFVVVPLEPLQEKTIYTVTLRKGLNLKSRNDPISEDYSFTFQTLQKGRGYQIPMFSLYEDFQQSSPSEPFITKVQTYNWKQEDTIKAEVYRFPTSSAFIDSRKRIDEIQSSWMTYYAEEEAVETSSLEKVMTVDLKVQNKDNINYLQLPDKLPQGFYLMQFWFGNKDKLEQLWLQSTELTGFVSVGKEQTVVWANNLNGGPSSNAVVRITGSGQDYRTYDNGASVFTTPSILFEKERHYVEIADTEGNIVIIPITSLSGNNPVGKITQNDYISYLYNERYLYKPGDTVYFFGVVKERSTNTPPGSATIILRNSSFSDKEAVLSKTIVPSSDGSFLDNFKLEDIPLGWYTLVLKVGDVEVESTSFSVTQFEKPEMKIEVLSNKKAMFTDEKVDYTAKVSFFDETPAKNIPITTHESTTSNSTNLTTGENGEVNYTYQTKYNDNYYYYYPHYETVTFIPAIAQESNVEGFGSVYVFGSRLMINSDSDQEGNNAKIKANVNNVDLSRINSGESNEYKGNPASGKEVALTVKKTWYERVESGTYYDFIEKITRKTYNYIRHEETVEEKKLTTDVNGEVSHEFQLEEGKSYSAELMVKDGNGHPAKTGEYYYYSLTSYGYGEGQKEFPQLNLDKDESTYSLGEEVKLNILLGENEYPDNDKNRFLFILANRGRQEVILTDNPRYTFTFDSKHIPNIYVGAYIFTGKYYSQVSAPCRRDWYCSDYYYYGGQNYFSGFLISYKKEDSELTLTIDVDKEKYQPGEDAKIGVKVENNGVGVPGATVNLILVDEALAALDAVRTPSILSSLYQSVDSLIYYNYSSHEPVLPDQPQAERGGGGGGDRDVFKDAAFFGREISDESGVATFSFTLPDNITSWITYAQALTSSVEGGQSEVKVIVTKDFFITSQFPKEYLVKDKPALTGGSFGKGLQEDSYVEFKAIFFESEREISNISKTTGAFKSINFPFPNLQAGEYKVSLRGKVNNLEDGVQLPFKAISSRLNFEHFQKFDLEKGQALTRIDATDILEDKPVKLVISDRGKGIYYSSLTRYCYTWSNRVEKQIAKLSASKLLVERFDDNECKVDADTLKDFQYFDGGLSQVEWGGSDLPTTVWAIFVDPIPFDKDKMISFFESKLNEENGGNLQKIYSSWGLTILGKPKVNELQILTQSALTYEEKVILAMALTSAGDTEKARDLYYDILADYAYEYPPYIRIQAELKGKSQIDNYIENTSRALLLGSLVEKTYDEAMFNYLRDFRSNTEDVVIDLSSIAFIDEQLNKLPDENTSISFASANQNVQKELEGRNMTLKLKANELNNFSFKVLEGKAEANFNYFVGALGLSELPTDNLLSIKREFKKVKGEGSSIKSGDIVEVRIDFNLDFDKSPTGCYTITDYLPSGLKYISNPSAYGLEAEGWMSEREGNIVEGFFCNSPWWREYGKKYMIYFARAGSVGEYVAEPAIIQSLRYLSNFQKTPEQTIKIEASNL